MKIYKLGQWEYWYDRSYRAWFAARFDSEGNQLGSAFDAYTKQEIISIINIYQGE